MGVAGKWCLQIHAVDCLYESPGHAGEEDIGRGVPLGTTEVEGSHEREYLLGIGVERVRAGREEMEQWSRWERRYSLLCGIFR